MPNKQNSSLLQISNPELTKKESVVRLMLLKCPMKAYGVYRIVSEP